MVSPSAVCTVCRWDLLDVPFSCYSEAVPVWAGSVLHQWCSGDGWVTCTPQTTANSNGAQSVFKVVTFCPSLIFKLARHWVCLSSTLLLLHPLDPWKGTAKPWLIFSRPGRSWRPWSETSRLLLSAPLTWTKTCWNSSTTGLTWVFNASERLL